MEADLNDVHTLRDAYGADQVALVNSGSGAVANGLWNLDPESEALAFCVNGFFVKLVFRLAILLGNRD